MTSVYADLAKPFDEREPVALTLAIVAIIGWNRPSVASRRSAGDYVPRHEPGRSD